MNNLKPNMYIRTKEGKIDKVLEINTEDFEEPTVRLASYPIGMYQGMFEYKKASFDIIDLIEEGDILKYVYDNKECVSKVLDRGSKMLLVTAHLEVSLGLVDIISIVTKEQFKSISYEVSK